MAAGDEPHAADSASTGSRNAAPSDANSSGKPNDSAHAEHRRFKNPRGRGRGRGKRRPDLGRAEWGRKMKDERREQTAQNRENKGDESTELEDGEQGKKKRGNDGQEWVEYKRRKVGDNGDGEAKANPFSKEEIAAEQRKPKRKVAVMVGYSGTGYKGMQVNGDEPTIERDLFRAFIAAGAISKANADDPRKSSLARCARTDKGVHAAGNVISLKLIMEDDMVEKINGLLPDQIRVWGIQRTNNAYNCYQTCDSRWYEYLLPSHCLLPPHPESFLGRKITELAKEYGIEEEMNGRMADVKDFWANVEEKDVKPLLKNMDPEIRAAVLEKAHVVEDTAIDENGDPPKTKKSDTSPAEEQKPDAEAAGAPAAEEQKSDAVETDKEKQPAEDNSTSAPTLTSVTPKSRELNPIDFALRDIKSAYINAKRNYRVLPQRIQQLQDILNKYEGTHNFHNYTVLKAFGDPSAKRHIKSFVVNPKPIIIGGTEWLSLKVHGQSFMMHQIRKMVGLASLMVRCGTSLDRVRESYQELKMAIPKAPGLGLLLEKPVFENYNNKAKAQFDKETIDLHKYEEKVQEFKDEHIYKRIFEVEARDNTFHSFFTQIDQFRSDHFLWLTAGGMKAAETSKDAAKGGNTIDKELGDEDEDPEGGEG